MNKPLALILHEKSLLEGELEENGGEITEELDRVWENNQLELAEKIDNYAWALKHMDSVIENLKERKAKATKIIQTIGNQQKRIKHRLHFYCEQSGGEPLRGHEYSFHPFMAKVSGVNQEKVEDQYRTVQVVMPVNQYRQILEQERGGLNGVDSNSWTITFPEVKVSELPDGHPAILEDTAPSVRMR